MTATHRITDTVSARVESRARAVAGNRPTPAQKYGTAAVVLAGVALGAVLIMAGCLWQATAAPESSGAATDVIVACAAAVVALGCVIALVVTLERRRTR